MITRRDLLRGVAGTAALLGWPPGHASGEPPPETTKLRLLKEAGRTCWAPQYVAADLLRAEGFTDVTYVNFPGGAVSEFLAAAKADISLHFVGPTSSGWTRGIPWCSSPACT